VAAGDDVAVLRTEEYLKLRLFMCSSMDRMVDGYESSFADRKAHRALEQPPLRSIIIDRTGRASSVSVFEPQAWCVLRCVALDMEEISRHCRRQRTCAIDGHQVSR
jgi:hypothetical protein